MAKQLEPDGGSVRDRPVKPTWEEKIRCGLVCIDRWADRYGVDDVPAARELLGQYLIALENLERSK